MGSLNPCIFKCLTWLQWTWSSTCVPSNPIINNKSHDVSEHLLGGIQVISHACWKPQEMVTSQLPLTSKLLKLAANWQEFSTELNLALFTWFKEHISIQIPYLERRLSLCLMFKSCASSKFVSGEGKHARRRAGRLLSWMEMIGKWKWKFPGGKTVGKTNCFIELEQTTSTVYFDFMWLWQCKLVLKTNKKMQTKPNPSLIFMILRQVCKHDLYITDGIQLPWVWILHNILSLFLWKS